LLLTDLLTVGFAEFLSAFSLKVVVVNDAVATELGCLEGVDHPGHHCQPFWAVPLIVREAVIIHGWIETWGNGVAIPDAQ